MGSPPPHTISLVALLLVAVDEGGSASAGKNGRRGEGDCRGCPRGQGRRRTSYVRGMSISRRANEYLLRRCRCFRDRRINVMALNYSELFGLLDSQ